MKVLGIVILCVGVAVAAAYGAQLSPPMHGYVTAKGRARLLAAEEEGAHAAYCVARSEASLAPAEGCGKGPVRVVGLRGPAPLVAARSAGKGEPVAGAPRERLAVLEAVDASELPEPVRAARSSWLARVEPALAAAEAFGAMTPPDPGQRLSEWGTARGPFFGIGLLLVVVGAVLGRIGIKREALREPSGKTREGAAPTDLGLLIAELRDRVSAMGRAMDEVEQPSRSDHDRFKDELHELQVDRFEALVNARLKVQARYGMGGFAEVYGPIASAERYSNRAWSALVDQHWPEARASVDRAASDLEQAHAILMDLAART